MTIMGSESGPGAEAMTAALAQAPFAQIAAAGGPVVLAMGLPARIVWSNASAQALFGADSLTIEKRLFHGSEPGARRVAELARSLVPNAPPRLERLRFFMSGRAEILTVLCRRISGPSPLFILAAPGLRSSPGPAPSMPPQTVVPAPQDDVGARALGIDATLLPIPAPSSQTPDAPQNLVPEPVAESGALAPPDVHGVADAQVETVPIVPRRSAEQVAVDLATRFGPATNVRFLWQTDEMHRFVKITGELCDLIGCVTDRLIGRSFAELAQELDLDPDRRLREALIRGETWSGIEVFWPVEGADAALPIMLGALPAHDRERRFEGFRGFGVIHISRVEALPRIDDANIVEAGAVSSSPTDAAVKISPGSLDEPGSAPTAGIVETPSPDIKPGSHPPASEIRASQDEADAVAAPGLPASGKGASGNVVSLRPFQVVPRRPALEPVQPKETEKRAVTPEPAREPEPTPEPTPVFETPTPPVAAGAPRASRADDMVSLSPSERLAFREIARALGARVRTETPADGGKDMAPASSGLNEAVTADAEATALSAPPAAAPSAHDRMRDLIEVATRAAKEEAQALDRAAELRETAGAAESLSMLGGSTPEMAPAPAVAAPSDAVLDRLPLGVIVSRGNDLLYINRTMLDLTGHADRQEFEDVGGLPALFKGRQGEALGEGLEGGAIPVVARNGDVVPLEVRMQTMEWGGELASLMTFRRAQENELAYRIRTLETELRASEAGARELHAILDTATDGVAVLDEQGQILALNRAGEALFGFDQNEVAGESFTILLAKESQETALEYLAGLRSSGVASVLNDGRDVMGRARQGGSIPLFMTLGRVGVGGKPKFCAVLRDMTPWKKAERELKEARREAEHASAMKSDFLAKISHEIRTPLNAILGFAEVIMDERFGPVGNERYKDYLKDIHASGSHVMSLVNDLLDLSKIEAGKLELNFGSVDANRVVSECVSLIQPQAARERVIVRLSLAPRLPNIVADERALRQIVLNLLSNAVKFNEPGGQVIVSSALTDAGHAVIRIRDTGIGMSEADIETALEPFRQVATSRNNTPGTGLGLPLTKALVEANRASFSIKSKKAEGTLVEVAFPPTRVLAE